MKNTQKICYMLIGIPGSGKSSIANEIKSQYPDVVIISSDIYIDKVAKEKGLTYSALYKDTIEDAEKWASKELENAIKNKKNIVWDQTNVFESARKKKITRMHQNKYEVIAMSLELTTEELNKRHTKRKNEGGKYISYKIIQNMIENYTRPHYGEGFVEIYLVNDIGALTLIQKPEIEDSIIKKTI